MKSLYEIVARRCGRLFFNEKKINDWLPWLKMHVDGLVLSLLNKLIVLFILIIVFLIFIIFIISHHAIIGSKYPTNKMILDPAKSVAMDITANGLQCHSHPSGTLFSTCISTQKVKTGKWYFEVKLHSNGLFQFGYVNDKYVGNYDISF